MPRRRKAGIDAGQSECDLGAVGLVPDRGDGCRAARDGLAKALGGRTGGEARVDAKLHAGRARDRLGRLAGAQQRAREHERGRCRRRPRAARRAGRASSSPSGVSGAQLVGLARRRPWHDGRGRRARAQDTGAGATELRGSGARAARVPRPVDAYRARLAGDGARACSDADLDGPAIVVEPGARPARSHAERRRTRPAPHGTRPRSARGSPPGRRAASPPVTTVTPWREAALPRNAEPSVPTTSVRMSWPKAQVRETWVVAIAPPAKRIVTAALSRSPSCLELRVDRACRRHDDLDRLLTEKPARRVVVVRGHVDQEPAGRSRILGLRRPHVAARRERRASGCPIAPPATSRWSSAKSGSKRR